MSFLNALSEDLRFLFNQAWARNLAFLIGVSLLAYLPGRLSAHFLRKWREAPRISRSKFWSLLLELLEVSFWPFWAMAFYTAAVFTLGFAYGPAGRPFQLLPILFFFLLYRVLIALTKELLPEGRRRRRIRRVMIPIVFLLVTLQQLGALGPIAGWATYPLVTISGAKISAVSIFVAVGLIVAFAVVARLAGVFLEARFLPGLGVDPTVSQSLVTLSRWGLVAIGIFVALNTLGVDLTTLKIVLGALGVGVGFGLQNVVNNFVSGLIILIERKLKQGDIIAAGGTDGRIINVGLRSSVIRTRAGHEIIVPNSDLTTAQVTNFSYHDRLVRMDLPVGVSYSADPNQVRDILLQAAKEDDRVVAFPHPDVMFIQYGNSSIDFQLRAWIDDPWKMPQVRSALYFSIWYRLKDAGIEIPFPQRDLHLRSGGVGIRLEPGEEE